MYPMTQIIYFITMYLIPLVIGFLIEIRLVPYFIKRKEVRGRGWISKDKYPKLYKFGIFMYILLGLYLMAMSYPLYLISLEV